MPRDVRVLPGLDTPWLPAAVVVAAATAEVVARFLVVAHGDVSAFILPGVDFARQSQVPKGIHVFPLSGYDGQFFFRLALNPTSFKGYSHGITLDTPYRLQRIGYPVLGWLVALGGRPALVPWTLIGINVASLGALGFVGGLFARDSGRHAAWGLLLAGFWGYAFSITRDVAEPLAAALLLAGLFALRRDRRILAGVLLAGSVLTRETGMALVAAIALVSLWDLRSWSTLRTSVPAGTGTSGPAGGGKSAPAGGGKSAPAGGGKSVWADARAAWHQMVWFIPTVAFVIWQLVIRGRNGANAARTDAGANLGKPFIAMLKALHHDLLSLHQYVSLTSLAQMVVLGLITLAALWMWRSSAAQPVEKLTWIIMLGLIVSLSAAVWSGTADFRSLDEMFLFDVILLYGSRMRLWWPALMTLGLWALVAVQQVRSI